MVIQNAIKQKGAAWTAGENWVSKLSVEAQKQMLGAKRSDNMLSKAKEIILTHFPEPSVITVETDVKYYDKKEGLFNKFEASDLTELSKESKAFIIDKIPESGLLVTAKKEALDTVLMIEKLIETSGWKLNYSQLVLENSTTKKLN